MISKIRNSYWSKGISFLLIYMIVFQFVAPENTLAITGGPSQPEVQSFEPVGTSQMVDPFTGDFTYNIPLMNIPGPDGGYPINLAYHSGISMEQEASWVGLGWNINVGSLNRQVRGLADDFNGDRVISKFDMKENFTIGIGGNSTLEVFGGSFLSMGNGIKYNSYTGMSVSTDVGLKLNAGASLGVSFDSQSGMTINAGLTLGDQTEYSTNLSYSSSGLGVSTSINFVSNYYVIVPHVAKASTIKINGPSGGSGTLTFSANQQQPNVGYKKNQYSLNLAVNFGAEAGGTYAGGGVSGFYSHEDILNRDKYVENKAYGYENLENYVFENNKIMDYSREKDRMVSPASTNLAVPNLTYDVYNVQGQGVGGMFRPYRTDVGKINDPRIYNNVIGGRVTIDIGAGSTAKVGGGGGMTYGYSLQRPWANNQNEWSSFRFKKQKELSSGGYDFKPEERVYYRMRGDKSTMPIDELDYIGGEDPLLALSTGINGKLKNPNSILNERIISPSNFQDLRVGRVNTVNKLTNAEIYSLHAGNHNISDRNDLGNYNNLGVYEVFYRDWDHGNANVNNTIKYLDRRSIQLSKFWEEGVDGKAGDMISNYTYNIGHHNGAFSVLNDNGQRYIYALPAYNKRQAERTYTVQNDGQDCNNIYTQGDWTQGVIPDYDDDDETDKFYMENVKPPSTYSHLLTSVLGADYIDVDNNGPTDEDLGYWVKFNYVKYADDYKWRHPYEGAILQRGNASTYDDDKASDVYGEKQKWYLHQIETKTHIAVFTLEEREDSKEAYGQNAFNLTGFPSGSDISGLKVTEIKLYVKSEYNADPQNAVAIKTAHFEYGDGLCAGTLNSTTANSSKLQLEKVYFTTRENTRGINNPYVFSYKSDYPYSTINYDRWGNYKPVESTCVNEYFPYVQQFSPANATESVLFNNSGGFNIDDWMSAWHLSFIDLPSGGRITIDYESDDYAYVQSEKATQMFNIRKVNDLATEPNQLYNEDQHADVNDKVTRRIYFRLEESLTSGATEQEESEEIYRRYVKDLIVDENGNRNLFFKIKSTLRSDGGGDIEDYVSGYIPLMPKDPINPSQGYDYSYGVDPNDNRMGFVTIQKQEKKKDNNGDPVYFDKYHPFAMASWQFIKLQNPKILQTPSFVNMGGSSVNDNDAIIDAASNLLGFLPQISQMFTGFRKHCYNKEYGQKIDLTESVIKLCSPDSKKYGGGSRVKEIKVFDKWSEFVTEENEAIYGMVYDYTMIENGEEISSGVATYEPQLGGDENALKYPKYFLGKIPFKENYLLSAEQPYNEDMFPGASVGYRKVTIKSLNTNNKMISSPVDNQGVAGIKEYQFYTAKDYPVILEQTQIQKNKKNLPIIIPFIGIHKTKELRAVQSYKIELNDMHGKLRSVKDFALDQNYERIEQPVSATEYLYQDEFFNYKYTTKHIHHHTRRLTNTVKTLNYDDGSQNLNFEDRIMGMEFDVTIDQRQSKSQVLSVGLDFNTDVMPSPTAIPIPTVWPSSTKDLNDLKTFASNKVIHKAGILKKVVSFDGQAKLETENLVFDEVSGQPVLTKVNNKYDQTIFKYDQPAHWYYEGMGAAFENINLEFTAAVFPSQNQTSVLRIISGPIVSEMLVPGDELLFSANANALECQNDYDKVAATYLGYDELNGQMLIDVTSVNQDASNCLLSQLCVSKRGDGQSCVNSNSLPILCDFRVIRSGRRNHLGAKALSISSLENPTLSSNRNWQMDTYYSPIVPSVSSSYNKLSLDKVINASAVTYNDGWESETNSSELMNLDLNPFKEGKSGIWRVNRSYTYNGQRTAFSNPEIDDLEESGYMDNVSVFNWNIQDVSSDYDEWEWFSENTKYNKNSYAIEGRNKLGIYSSALYGYAGMLSIGVGSNAEYYELGTEDFENYDTQGQTFPGGMNQGNLSFGSTTITQSISSKLKKTFVFEDGISVGNSIKIRLNRNISDLDNWNIKDGETVSLQVENLVSSMFHSKVRKHSIVVEIITVNDINPNLTEIEVLPVTAASSNNTSFYPDPVAGANSSWQFFVNNTLLKGSVTGIKRRSIMMPTEATNVNGEISFTDEFAHTGKKALKFDGTSSSGVYFAQPNINLIPNKEYNLSFWVRKENEHVFNYGALENLLEIEQFVGGTLTSIADANNSIGTFSVTNKIEGWQKIDITFTAQSDEMIRLKLTPYGATDKIWFIDDIRISPAKGGIKTFVYDPIDYKLRAELNANNYATLYFYDEEENLYLVKKETAEGIKTLKEVRGHARPNQ